MKIKNILRKIILIFLLALVVILTAIAIWVNSCLKEVRNIELSLDREKVECCYIVDNENNVKKIYSNNSVPIKISNLNPNTINAFISIEDKDFYKHKGINIKRIIKSTISNLTNRKIVSGASTITQQLVKNKYLTNDRTLKRKVQEIYLSRKLERMYDKDKIMEAYLNEIYYGNGAYGIENASLRFFSKPASELTLAESCILAGSINSPNMYSPINNIDGSLSRRNLILREMRRDKVITDAEYNNAISEEIILSPSKISARSNMDLYDEFAITEATEILGVTRKELFRKGYKIYTGKSKNTQKSLEETINNEKYYEKNTNGEIADSLSMIIDNKSNLISAIAGKSEYNLVGLERQPGSLIKPVLVYGPAMEEGLINPLTEIYDDEINYDGYSPRNVGGYHKNYVSVKDAIADSLNVPAVKVCNMLGIDKCKSYASKCGLNFSTDDTGYAIALGGMTNGFTLQTILDSYSPFIYNGNYRKSSCIRSIKDRDGLTIYNNLLSENKVYNDDISYLMTDMLKYATKNGTSRKLSNLKYDIAGKTGTVGIPNTNLNSDVYSLAYTTGHRMAVWLGNYSMDYDRHLCGSNNGGTYATEMVKDICNDLYRDSTPEPFAIPDSIVSCKVDANQLSNKHKVYLASESLPDRYTITENFSARYLPETFNYDNENDIDIEVSLTENKIQVCFIPKNYNVYSLYKIVNSKEILLNTYQNRSKEIEYEDRDISANNKYTYYLKCYSTLTDKEYYSERKSIYVDNSLADNSDIYSWLFA